MACNADAQCPASVGPDILNLRGALSQWSLKAEEMPIGIAHHGACDAILKIDSPRDKRIGILCAKRIQRTCAADR